ncbi:hypothetical protein BKG83_16300 [Mycobacteroides chelonae]|nr:hypothetical protein BKG83_16300 [Mycobacteroides chelonae]
MAAGIQAVVVDTQAVAAGIRAVVVDTQGVAAGIRIPGVDIRRPGRVDSQAQQEGRRVGVPGVAETE